MVQRIIEDVVQKKEVKSRPFFDKRIANASKRWKNLDRGKANETTLTQDISSSDPRHTIYTTGTAIGR